MVKAALPNLTPAQATYVLQELVRDRKLTYNDIVGMVARMRNEIKELEARLAQLRNAAPDATPARGARSERAARQPSRRAQGTQAASRKVQGHYLALLRQIPKPQRGKYQAIAREQSREAAITAMRAAREK